MAAPPAAPGVFEIGDVLATEEFGSFSLSPDGRFLVMSRIEYVRGAGRYARIVACALDEGDAGRPAPETVVFHGEADGWSPDFADDSIAILFLTDVSGEARPWVAADRDAVPAPVEAVTRMAVAPKWRPGLPRRGFAFLSFATRAEQGFPDPQEWGAIPAAGYRQLYVVDTFDAPLRKLTAAGEDVYDYAWSPDGERIAVLASPSFEMERHLESELRVLRASDGEVLARRPLPPGLSAFLSWSPAGDHLAYIAHGHGGRIGKAELHLVRLDGGERSLTSEVPGWVSRYDWAPGGAGLWFPAAEGVRTALYYAPRDGEGYGAPRVVHRPEGFLSGISVAKKGSRIALRLEGPRTPPLVAVGEAGPDGSLGPLRAVTARSLRREARIPGDGVALTATAADGRPVDAVVLHPRRGEPARRPVCVWLHGGPNEFCALSYQPWWQLFVARGYTVLAPNARGSGSYEQARVRGNVGDLGGGDAADVVACLDALAAHPVLGAHADVDRLVLFGWSYGAHLAFHVVRHLAARMHAPTAHSVRRIVAGAGVYDWLSHYGETELRFPWRDYLGGSPLLDAREADARSPVRHAAALGPLLAGAEVLLVAGQHDGRASPIQSRLMHRALLEAGARSTFLVYPREAHVFVEPDHVRDLLERATRPLGG